MSNGIEFFEPGGEKDLSIDASNANDNQYLGFLPLTDEPSAIDKENFDRQMMGWLKSIIDKHQIRHALRQSVLIARFILGAPAVTGLYSSVILIKCKTALKVSGILKIPIQSRVQGTVPFPEADDVSAETHERSGSVPNWPERKFGQISAIQTKITLDLQAATLAAFPS